MAQWKTKMTRDGFTFKTEADPEAQKAEQVAFVAALNSLAKA